MQRTPAALELPKHLDVSGGATAAHSAGLVTLLGHVTFSTPIRVVALNPPRAVPPETQQSNPNLYRSLVPTHRYRTYESMVHQILQDYKPTELLHHPSQGHR